MASIGGFCARYPFSQQPGHCMIVDLTTSFTQESIDHLCDGIMRFANLLCSIRSGPKRVPHFSILCAIPYPEMLLPFTQLNNESLGRIQAAVMELKRISAELNVSRTNDNPSRVLEHSIRDAVTQFQKFKRNATVSSKLELTVVCFQSPGDAKPAISKALRGINLSDIPRVSCVGMAPDGNYSSGNTGVRVDSECDNDGVDLTGVLDFVSADSDPMSIELFMRRWLYDRSTEREHLNLYFASNENGLKIKCDLRERLIDPAELPFNHSYDLIPSSDQTRSQQAMKSTKQTEAVPITKLQIVQQVPSNTVCESVLFGHPYIMYSSRCWRMEWEELETNQNRFLSFSQYLIDNEMSVVCKNITPQPTRRGRVQPRTAFFLILPAASPGTLLIKSVGSRDLVMDYNDLPTQAKWDITSLQARAEITKEMGTIESHSTFNPLLLHSNTPQLPNTTRHRPTANPVPAKRAAVPLNKTKPANSKARRFQAPRQDGRFGN